MRIIELPEIRRALDDYGAVLVRMREALAAYSRGECDMPPPMHLAVDDRAAEVHIKSGYRRGGKYFVLKIAGTFPQNVARGISTSNGMMLLSSAETGEPLALLNDSGYLTDVRTAAVAALVAHDCHRTDTVMGVLGTGTQALLQIEWHAKAMPIADLWIWGRNPARTEEMAATLRSRFRVHIARNSAEVAEHARLIVTATAAREPLLREVAEGTHVSAVGSDSVGKQELSPEVLKRATTLLVDSRSQCARLGELQHAPGELHRAIEMGEALDLAPGATTVADFTGLGVEDLYIAEYCYERIAA